MITSPFETERILLRPAKVTDAKAVYNNWTSDPDVSKFMRWNTHESIDDTITWLASNEANANNPDKTSWNWLFVLKEINEPIGSGGVFYNKTHDMLELGYCLMKSRWGQGLATEAARGILDFAAHELGARKFFVCHAKDNPASGKVIEKLGFVYKNDGSYSSFDGKRTHNTREYFLIV